MSFGPEKKPMGIVWDENTGRKRGEHEIVIEAKGGLLENVKTTTALKGVLAIGRGLIWLEWHGLKPFGDTMSEADKEKVKNQGWLKTAFEKTVEAYNGLGKAEEYINEHILEGDTTLEDILGDAKKEEPPFVDPSED